MIKELKNVESINIDSKFNEVIPTAILTAYPRTFSDITYSQEIFNELKHIVGKISEEQMVTRIAVELEARSKIIDNLIKEQDTTQILELAAGFSSRGISFSKNPDIVYAEIDLPEVSMRKKQVLSNIISISNNLHIDAGNVLRESDFERADQYFNSDKSIIVVNEGLLRYLSFDEKTKLAINIRTLLKKHDGVWISGDGSPREFKNSRNKNIKSLNTTILNQTKNIGVGDAFEDQVHFRNFFEDLGFTLEFHDLTEVTSELVSPVKLGLSEEAVRDKLLSYATVVVFKLKSR
jgi:O-methyltransferase involved in polyketide biosynthesis